MERQDLQGCNAPTACNGSAKKDSFHLTLFNDDEMYELLLPEIPEGIFSFNNTSDRYLCIQAKNERWMAVCRKPAFFQNVPLEQSYGVQLADGQMLKIDCEDNSFLLLVESVSTRQMVYHNYTIEAGTEISIGSHAGNTICYDHPCVSRKHASMCRSGGKWAIDDYSNEYGVFVNGKKQRRATLETGDLIYIMGLRIIVGPSFLSISDGIGHLNINRQILQTIPFGFGGYSRYYSSELTPVTTSSYYNRLPRKRFDSSPKVITVEGPPMSMDQRQIPLILRMGSSMVMGGAAALAGNFMTLISSVMFPFLSSKYTEKQKQEYEELRLRKYTEYLENKRKEIEAACREEHEFLNKKYPRVRDVLRVATEKTHLWERRPGDSDFLHVRLGTGKTPISTTIEYPVKRFELETDELEEKMYKLVETPYFVENAPIVFPVVDVPVCGLLGERERIITYIYQLVAQITTFHSYDEVKLVLFVKDEELKSLESICYLPHIWDDQRTRRFIATNEAEAYRLGEYLKDQLFDDADKQSDRQQDIQKVLKKHPFYLMLALDKKLFEGHEALKDILQSDWNLGASVITAYDDLPKEAQRIITLKEGYQGVCTTMCADGGEDNHFTMDPCSMSEIHQAMHTLANIQLKTAMQAQEMPKMVTFLEMFNVGRVEQLNPLKRWKDNNPIKSLAAPVGVGSDGSLFTLDLHEKRQGPHGLVAGMTGSGKSEFIITYILSMAVNYHPDEVAFLLIDYKGGGLAGAFDNPQTGVRLPHLVGTITNLDGASIQRSLMSIESELIRRQKKFNEVKSIVNEGTMDIYAYQKLYRAGKVSEPMPHLFIISDEFAELKQQQPEFMDKLISAARIGRSLGVHLILATQKPSGVVNDQIRSNTKFRVCLRVQDRSDSMDMLKRPEAAELTDTGRFYLQVGYNEYFALGQSAWCGADYEPQDFVSVQKDDAVEFLDISGQVVAKAKPKVKKSDSGMKQLVAVVQYLSELAQRENVRPRQLWIEPLPKVLELNSLDSPQTGSAADGVSVTIGMIDDPEKQMQYPLSLDLTRLQHLMLVGNAGSGKTTLLKALLLNLTRKYSSEQVNYYIVDCSGGTLGVFKKAPHCGAFLTDGQENEVDRLLSFIQELIQERKKLFGAAGVTSYEAYIQKNPIPLVLVVIDNFSGFTAMKAGNVYFADFHQYLKESSSLGIKIIASCGNLSEMNMRSKQEINDRLALQLKDKYAYGEALNCKGTFTPAEAQGRGMCLYDGRLLEYQTGLPFCEMDEIQRTTAIADEVAAIAERSQGRIPARRLPMVSEEETYTDFCSDIPAGRIPLGYELRNATKISIPLAQLYRAALYLGNPAGTTRILSNFIFATQKNGARLIVVKRSDNSILDTDPQLLSGSTDCRIFDSSQKSASDLCICLCEEIKQRKQFRNEYCSMNNISLENAKSPVIVKKAAPHIRKNTKPLFILIEDFCEFSSNTQGQMMDVFKDIFANGMGYNIYFISCFYPEQRDKLSVDPLTKSFADGSLALFFGGQFNNQALINMPMEYRKIDKPQKQYNRFLMQYNGALHPLVMPCGILEEEVLDPDERPII